jgi:hypothetical protein
MSRLLLMWTSGRSGFCGRLMRVFTRPRLDFALALGRGSVADLLYDRVLVEAVPVFAQRGVKH